VKAALPNFGKSIYHQQEILSVGNRSLSLSNTNISPATATATNPPPPSSHRHSRRPHTPRTLELPLGSTTTAPVCSPFQHATTEEVGVSSIMKIFQSTTHYDYDWEHVSTANWQKYSPWNEKTPHVIAVDTLSRHVDAASGVVSARQPAITG
jgi:hypothetical protein